MSDLEKDFEQVINKINEKIAESAKALQEANKLAKDAGLTSLYNYDSNFYKSNFSKEEIEKKIDLLHSLKFRQLFNELDNAGWSTSNLHC